MRFFRLHHALARNANPERPANPAALPDVASMVAIHLVFKHERIANAAEFVNEIQIFFKDQRMFRENEFLRKTMRVDDSDISKKRPPRNADDHAETVRKIFREKSPASYCPVRLPAASPDYTRSPEPLLV